MPILGAHQSIAGGFHKAVELAAATGCQCVTVWGQYRQFQMGVPVYVLIRPAYAGHNICLPNLALKLAPTEEKSPYVAAHEALASICHAAATLAGGFLLDWLSDSSVLNRWGLSGLNPYVAIFGFALLLRLLAVPLAMAIVEPGAWRWRQILGRSASPPNTSVAGSAGMDHGSISG
jgi:hypothetical protein